MGTVARRSLRLLPALFADHTACGTNCCTTATEDCRSSTWCCPKGVYHFLQPLCLPKLGLGQLPRNLPRFHPLQAADYLCCDDDQTSFQQGRGYCCSPSDCAQYGPSGATWTCVNHECIAEGGCNQVVCSNQKNVCKIKTKNCAVSRLGGSWHSGEQRHVLTGPPTPLAGMRKQRCRQLQPAHGVHYQGALRVSGPGGSSSLAGSG